MKSDVKGHRRIERHVFTGHERRTGTAELRSRHPCRPTSQEHASLREHNDERTEVRRVMSILSIEVMCPTQVSDADRNAIHVPFDVPTFFLFPQLPAKTDV